jgi:hypothetical protein
MNLPIAGWRDRGMTAVSGGGMGGGGRRRGVAVGVGGPLIRLPAAFLRGRGQRQRPPHPPVGTFSPLGEGRIRRHTAAAFPFSPRGEGAGRRMRGRQPPTLRHRRPGSGSDRSCRMIGRNRPQIATGQPPPPKKTASHQAARHLSKTKKRPAEKPAGRSNFNSLTEQLTWKRLRTFPERNPS